MTIQAIDVTALGIVMAADGAISYGGAYESHPRPKEHWRRRKLFQIDSLRAGIGYFGLAQIGGKPLYQWLEKFIHANADAASPAEFAKRLADAVSRVITPAEAAVKTGFHLACYRQSPHGPVPEMHYVRNKETDKPSAGREFVTSEELLGRHFQELNEAAFVAALRDGRTVFFQNGYNGVYNAFSTRLLDGLSEGVWNNSEFIPKPETIREWGAVTEYRLRVIRLTFERFYKERGHHPVGGRLRFLAIPANARLPIEQWTA